MSDYLLTTRESERAAFRYLSGPRIPTAVDWRSVRIWHRIANHLERKRDQKRKENK